MESEKRNRTAGYIGEKTGYGVALFVFVTIFFHIGARFIHVPEPVTYTGFIIGVMALYVLVLVARGLRK